MSFISEYMAKLVSTIQSVNEHDIKRVVGVLKEAVTSDRQIFVIGNGGSAAAATHLACDLQKGLKHMTGNKARAMSLTDNVSIITAYSNDMSYDCVFSEQLDSLMQLGDVVVAISGSGNSKNVIEAVEKANSMEGITIGWSGFDGGELAQIAKVPIIIDSDNMQRIEDMHMVLAHVTFLALCNELAP